MKPGEVFDGSFRLEHVLGEGGFSTVYSALDPHGRRVALKVLKRGPDGDYDASTRARFEREVGLVSRLRGPHNVRLFGSGQAPTGELYAVFEHIPGRDLGELLDDVGWLDTRTVLRILRQVLEALDEAHREGLLHRDLKPENVRVFEDGQDQMTVKLLDFGIARATDAGHPAITRTGEIVGTPRYMSPEQLLDQPLSPASDIYSLGVMMFELLLGRAALGDGGWGAQLGRLQAGHVLELPEMDRIAAPLLAVLRRMTAREASQRFQNVGAVLGGLARVRPDSTLSMSAPISDAVAPTLPRRTLVLAAIVLTLAAAALATVLFVQSNSADEVEPAAQRRELTLLKTDEPPEPMSEPDTDLADLGAPDVGVDLGRTLPPEDPTGGTEGCGTEPSFVGGGTLRGATSYATFVPTEYRRNYKHPVIILLHQDSEDPARLLAHSGFIELAERDQFIVVAPNHPTPFNAWREDEDDIPIIRGGVELAARQFCIDPRRVFAVGHAQGGRAAHFLSCEDWIAGIGTFAHAAGSVGDHCRGPAPPKPIVMVGPTDSPHAPLNGGESCSSLLRGGAGKAKKSIQKFEHAWYGRNRCTGDPTKQQRGPHVCFEWPCSVPLHSCHVEGGHGWPGSEPRALHDSGPCRSEVPPTNFPLAEKFWEVFSRVELP